MNDLKISVNALTLIYKLKKSVYRHSVYFVNGISVNDDFFKMIYIFRWFTYRFSEN